jgi:hypothetical protein
LCVEEWELEYTGYLAGSVAPTRESLAIDCKASTAIDANHPRHDRKNGQKAKTDPLFEAGLSVSRSYIV